MTTIQNSTQEIIQLHQDIEIGYKTALQKAIRIGELITEMKSQLEHGEFGKWIQDNLPFSERTARRYMTVYLNPDKIKTDTMSLLDAYKQIKGEKPKEFKENAFSKFTPSTPEEYLRRYFALGGRVNTAQAEKETGLGKNDRDARLFSPQGARLDDLIIKALEETGRDSDYQNQSDVRPILEDIIRGSAKQNIENLKTLMRVEVEKQDEIALLLSLWVNGKEDYPTLQRIALHYIERNQQGRLEIRNAFEAFFNELDQSVEYIWAA